MKSFIEDKVSKQRSSGEDNVVVTEEVRLHMFQTLHS